VNALFGFLRKIIFNESILLLTLFLNSPYFEETKASDMGYTREKKWILVHLVFFMRTPAKRR